MAKKKMTLEEKLEEAVVKEGPYEVPENWIWCKLDSISTLVTGNTPSKKNAEYYGEYIPFIKPNDLEQGRTLKYSIEMLSNLGAEKARILPKGSTAVCCIGSIGKTAYLEVEGATNQQINSIIPNKVNKLYIYYYVLSEYFQKELVSNSSATTIAIINKSKMGKLAVPLPPLKEQQRIVDKIESLFEKLHKAKELIEEAREDFEKRKFSIIYKGISGELTKNKSKIEFKNGISIPEDWEWIEFKNLGKLERGRSKHRPRNDQRLFGGEYPFIQTGDIANSNVYVIEHKQTLSEFGLNQSRLFKKGTLCITIAANIGDVAILTYDCCFPDSVVGFTPNENIESKYIYYFLTLIKRDLEHFAPATAQKNINLKILGDVEIPVPSLEQQQEIVKILDKLLEEESKVEELTALEEQIELIKKSILAKAFRGQLGTNCEEDESALELLKDILKEQ